MSSVTKPKGPLPARVYWTRRLLALGVALGLVFGVGRLLDGEGGEAGEAPSARPAAAPRAPAPSYGPTPDVSTNQQKEADRAGGDGKSKAADKSPLAVPTGTCDFSDIKVVPEVVEDAFAIQDVTITLELSTLESPACTWVVSPKTLVLKVTSGSDRIWTSQDCPKAVPTRSVVLRSESTAEVEVIWSGQRSDDGCTREPDWARPGYYHVSAAAYGAEPADHQFQLREQVTATITKEPEPKPERKGEPERRDQPENKKNKKPGREQ